ncbi:MAG: urease accessory UreF family protein [Sulfitobacter sp.]
MTTNAEILTLAQWLSPAFPVGAFVYSHGLETAIQDERIKSAKTLEVWLSDVLQYGTGKNDCILLRAAFASPDADALLKVDVTARAFAASAERLKETQLQGAAFAATTAAIWGEPAMDLTYPVAVGAAAARLKINVDLTCAMYLQAFASNLVSAAVRLVPLGQTEGQAVLAQLTPLCGDIAAATQTKTLDDLQSTAFVSDIAAMHHETLSHRIFRS